MYERLCRTCQEWKEKGSAWLARVAKGKYALPILALLAFAESVFFPIPVEAVLVPFILAHREKWRSYVAVAAFASIAGGVAGYGIGLFFFDLFGEKVIALYGFEKEFAHTAELLKNSTFEASFISAFTPIPYKVFTLTAGVLAAPFFLFILGSILGRSLRFFIIGYLSDRFGPAVTRFVFKQFTFVSIIVVLVAAALFLLFA